jgi:hypothetical protein
MLLLLWLWVWQSLTVPLHSPCLEVAAGAVGTLLPLLPVPLLLLKHKHRPVHLCLLQCVGRGLLPGNLCLLPGALLVQSVVTAALLPCKQGLA